VKRCKAVGVEIIADAVVNHMAAGSGTGVAGTAYGGRNYKEYSPQDFHHNGGDTSSNCVISNYNDKFNVQHCDLVGLPDLDTSSDYVQGHIASFIDSIMAVGCKGVRLDASKHIDDGELGSILGRVKSNPYVFMEVIGAAGEAVQADQYYHDGHVTEFHFGYEIKAAFSDGGSLTQIDGLDQRLLPSGTAVTFVDNHDTQRNGATLNYKSGQTYLLATYFLLAYPYGYPKIMSSYYFDDNDQGPPGSPVHDGGNVRCGSGNPWVCEHRMKGVKGFVALRNAADGEGLANYHSEGSHLAFSRGSKAFAAFNKDGGSWSTTLQTGMPAGTYCNVVTECADKVTVGSDGKAQLNVPGKSAVAFYV
jgi:alpha-amylase